MEEKCDLLKFVHDRALVIMDYVHEVCEKENIPYSLFGGTLIGAIRHNGFIPWDDDLDVVMLRSDFDRFFEAVKKHPHPEVHAVMGGNHWLTRLTFREPQIYKNWKVLNINADIFSLDKVPNEPKKFKKLVKKFKFHQAMCRILNPFNKANKLSFKRKLYVLATGALGLLQSEKGRCRRINKLPKKYQGENTTDLFCSSDDYDLMRFIYKKEWMDIIDTPFEGRAYKIYSGYDEFLRCQYGDYMVLPPENERYILNHIKWFPADRQLRLKERIKVRRYLRKECDL